MVDDICEHAAAFVSGPDFQSDGALSGSREEDVFVKPLHEDPRHVEHRFGTGFGGSQGQVTESHQTGLGEQDGVVVSSGGEFFETGRDVAAEIEHVYVRS